MLKKYLFIITILFSFSAFAQESQDIFEVARSGNLDQVTVLFEQNPKIINAVNDRGYTPLTLACYRGNTEVAKFLISNGADINYNNDMGTPLMAAIFKKNNEIAKFLIENKANLNLSDGNRTTALIYAVNSKNYELVSALVKANVDVELQDGQKKSAIDYALLLDDDKLIELLKNKNKKL
ncbi:ankyrin repeat domain-containing protein [Flavobacterium sp. SM2513]|uniref:ankyrin repeat domain-containing protein n=1 Tax=Flavobacterium sp. SM2513 TaxID=3424766 RepID=UPI003D7FDE16